MRAVRRRIVMAARARTGQEKDETGSALVEFSLLAVVALVPLVYLVFALGRIQAGAYAAQAAAREAGRVFVTAPSPDAGRRRAVAAAVVAVADQGFAADAITELEISCATPDCLRPQSRIPVRVVVDVDLPGMPRGFSSVVPAQIEMQATHIATVDRFRARR
ncbi:MAG: pilus assembly protein [Angustibacter sp.]